MIDSSVADFAERSKAGATEGSRMEETRRQEADTKEGNYAEHEHEYQEEQYPESCDEPEGKVVADRVAVGRCVWGIRRLNLFVNRVDPRAAWNE